MDIMAVFAAFLEISRRSLGPVEIVLLCSFHDIASTLNIRFSKIHGVLRFLGLEKPGSLSEQALELFSVGCDVGGITGHQVHPQFVRRSGNILHDRGKICGRCLLSQDSDGQRGEHANPDQYRNFAHFILLQGLNTWQKRYNRYYRQTIEPVNVYASATSKSG